MGQHQQSEAQTAPVAFNNANLSRATLWMAQNDAALRALYRARGGRLPQPSNNTLEAFARAQRFLTFCVNEWRATRETAVDEVAA